MGARAAAGAALNGGSPAAAARGKRPAPSADVVDRALKLAAEGWSGEEIDRELGLHAAAEGREITQVADEAMAQIVRELFGSGARIRSSVRLGPLTTHGIQRRGGFTGNLVYALVLERPRRRLILRFNRGLREDVYDQERRNYALVREATGIRGPEILLVDRSHRLAPSEFMVMEHVDGELGSYLSHPDNPDVTADERRRIRSRTGEFYAALHHWSRPAGDPMHETRRLLFGLYRLLDVAGSPTSTLDPAEVRRCIEAFQAAPALRSDTASLCFTDGELLFAKRKGRWEPAFVCDLEWVGHRDRHADLVSALCAWAPLWSLPSAGVSQAVLREARRDPFFLAYQERLPVDWDRLAAIVPHHQLALWGHALADQPSASAREALWMSRRDLLTALIRHVQR